MSRDSNGGGPAPANNTQLLAARVGKYLMLELLGQGAFGKVRLAVDETDGQQYAIKIMEKSHIKANELTLQVRREIAVMKAMRHPNIVNLHEVLTSSKNLYMVMDLVTGGELFDAVAQAGRLPESRARLYFQQLVDGVHYCHKRRVYHRDLKPENLLLTDDKQTIKITDFGLSSIKASNAPDELLHTIMGSPHYIAPEIITSAAAGYDGAKVDVWASGVILFGMLAGFLPFDEQSMNLLYRSIVKKQVNFPSHFSYDVVKLLKAMLQKDPSKRPTMDDVRQFNWFRVNYQPAISDEVVNCAVPVPAPKKGKLRARVKKAAAARVRKKQTATTDGTKQPSSQPVTPSNNVDYGSSANNTPSSRERAQDRERGRGPNSAQDQHTQSYRNPYQRTVATPNNVKHRGASASMAAGDGTRQSRGMNYSDMEPSVRESLLTNQSLPEPPTPTGQGSGSASIEKNTNHPDGSDMPRSGTSNAQRISTSAQSVGSNAHRTGSSTQRTGSSAQRVGSVQRVGSSANRAGSSAVCTGSAAHRSGSINQSKSGGVESGESDVGSGPKRPPMLTEMMPSGEQADAGGKEPIMVNGALSFNLNDRDVHNACEPVQTPMQLGRIPDEARIERRPFSTNAASLAQRTSQNPLQTKPFSMRASASLSKKQNEYNRCGSVDTNGRISSNNSTHSHSRRELSSNSNSGGFRDGVKKVLENGLEALSTRYSRSNKAQFSVEMPPKLSLQNLFSSHHPADIPLHTGQPTPDKNENDVDEDMGNMTKTTTEVLSARQTNNGVVDHQREQFLRGAEAQPSDSQPRVCEQAIDSEPHHHISASSEDQFRPPPISPPYDSEAAQPSTAPADIEDYNDEETMINNQTNEFISPLSLKSDNTFAQESASSITSKDENPFTVIADEEEKENVVVDNALLSQCSPITSTNASSGNKFGIFKPAKSVFKPLVKQLLKDDDNTLQFTDTNACNESKPIDVDAGVSSEWGDDQGDVFADYEAEGESMNFVHPNNSKRAGTFNFINDLRHAQSLSNNLPSSSSNMSMMTEHAPNPTAKSEYGNPNSKAIFGNINDEMALKLSISTANESSVNDSSANESSSFK